MDDRFIRQDRLRYMKNTASSRLAILAILFDVLYFISLYKSDVGSFYYTILIGASILYNLVFMLLTFLASEGVKRYKTGYTWLLIVLGTLQVARIFILPMQAIQAEVTVQGEPVRVMGYAQFIRIVIYLAASAACCIFSALINWRKSMTLKNHLASLKELEAKGGAVWQS